MAVKMHKNCYTVPCIANFSKNDISIYPIIGLVKSGPLIGATQGSIPGDIKFVVTLVFKKYLGQPRPLFCLFLFFSSTNYTEKLQASAGFELGSSQLMASTLTTSPPPRPLSFSQGYSRSLCKRSASQIMLKRSVETGKRDLKNACGNPPLTNFSSK